MTTDSPPEEIFLLPLRTRGSKAAAFTFVGMDLPLERGLKTTSGKDETINSHKIHTGGWGFIFTRGAWHHHHLLSDMVYAFIHAAMIKQLNVENRSLVKVMKQKSYFKFYGFKEKKRGGGGEEFYHFLLFMPTGGPQLACVVEARGLSPAERSTSCWGGNSRYPAASS